jgi:fructose-specific phosphotransferase system IIA component
MPLTDILHPDCVKVPLEAADKKSVIFELIDMLASGGYIEDTESLRDAVWQREQTRTTGIGHGLAIPHGKSDSCDKLAMAVGKPAQPIDFDAIDKKPVYVVFLLVSPVDQTGPHIQALARISRLMTSEAFRTSVHDAGTSEALYELLANSPEEVA